MTDGDFSSQGGLFSLSCLSRNNLKRSVCWRENRGGGWRGQEVAAGKSSTFLGAFWRQAAQVFLQSTEITGKRIWLFLVCILRKLSLLVFVYKSLISICWNSSLWCKMWLLNHPDSLNSPSCFLDQSEWCNTLKHLTDLKPPTYSSSNMEPFARFDLVPWDTLSGCHEITLSGITGWGSIYLLFFAVGLRWPCGALSWILVMVDEMSGCQGDRISQHSALCLLVTCSKIHVS